MMGMSGDLTTRVVKHFLDPLVRDEDSKKVADLKQINTYLSTAVEIGILGLYFAESITGKTTYATIFLAEIYRNIMNYALNSYTE